MERTVEDRLIYGRSIKEATFGNGQAKERHFSMVYNTIHENCNVQLYFSSQH